MTQLPELHNTCEHGTPLCHFTSSLKLMMKLKVKNA